MTVEMMRRRITQSDPAMDIPGFFGGPARLPEAYDVAIHRGKPRLGSAAVEPLLVSALKGNSTRNEEDAQSNTSVAVHLREST